MTMGIHTTIVKEVKMPTKIIYVEDVDEDLGGEVTLTPYGVQHTVTTSVRIIPWHRIKEVIQTGAGHRGYQA